MFTLFFFKNSNLNLKSGSRLTLILDILEACRTCSTAMRMEFCNVQRLRLFCQVLTLFSVDQSSQHQHQNNIYHRTIQNRPLFLIKTTKQKSAISTTITTTTTTKNIKWERQRDKNNVVILKVRKGRLRGGVGREADANGSHSRLTGKFVVHFRDKGLREGSHGSKGVSKSKQFCSFSAGNCLA